MKLGLGGLVMRAESEVSNGARITGYALSVIVILTLIADGIYSLIPSEALRQMSEQGGFKLEQAPMLGIIMLICGVLYAIPRTTYLGAILATGFFGGAICTEVRIGGSPAEIASIVLCMMVWAGLFLRDSRLRALLPLTS
jgi:hypothetical protein